MYPKIPTMTFIKKYLDCRIMIPVGLNLMDGLMLFQPHVKLLASSVCKTHVKVISLIKTAVV